MKKVRKAIITAATGLGARFLLATKAIPKEMLPIVNKPTIQYKVEEAVALSSPSFFPSAELVKCVKSSYFSVSFCKGLSKISS